MNLRMQRLGQPFGLVLGMKGRNRFHQGSKSYVNSSNSRKYGTTIYGWFVCLFSFVFLYLQHVDILGPGRNLSCSCDLHCHCSNGGSLTHCTTWELLYILFKSYLQLKWQTGSRGVGNWGDVIKGYKLAKPKGE